MKLSTPQIALLSRLLDEAIPLDVSGRRLWLDRLSPEHQDLAPALWSALLAGSALEPAGRHADLQPGARVGPYELIRTLGVGGMAQVWLARRADGAFKREVALKLPKLRHPPADLDQRFSRERDILASLEHPRIARFYDAGIDPSGLPYFAMECVRGERLTVWCDNHQLGVRERLQLVLQVLDALQYAHAHEVIHRDIKPSNILVNEAGQVRLLDFGVAGLLAPEAQPSRLTLLYGRGLTPEYASPELARGDPVDPTSDVYALGVVLYELLTGCLPYRIAIPGSAAQLEEAIVAAEVPKPSKHLAPGAGPARSVLQEKLVRQLSGDLDAIVLKTLAKAPPDRYNTAAALADDLERYLLDQPVGARPDRFTYRLGKRIKRHPREWAITATAVAAAGTVAFLLVWPLQSVPMAAGRSKSIAVLPFLDMSERQDQEYFSDGLSEELIDRLVHSADLRVIARTSSFQFKGKNVDVRSIASKLGVTHVLEGSVRKAGQQLRITAQLIRASDGAHLWSQTYDRDLLDIFKVQDEIGAKVTQALDVALRSTQRSGNREPDARAYSLVLEGNYFKARMTLPDVAKAALLYRQAIDIEPDYALAYARLASAYLIEEMLKGSPSEDQNGRVLDALARAIQLDPNLVWAYYTRGGFAMNISWDWAAARADTERMRAIDPKFSFLASALGDIALTFGAIDRAAELYQHDLERNPLDSNVLDSLAIALCAANRLEQCLQTRLRLLELNPEFGGVNSSVGIARLYLGQLPAALDAMQRESDEANRLGGLAMVYTALGEHAESDAALDALQEKFAASDAYGIAEVHAYRGENDAAFLWLDRAYRQHHSGMLGLKADPLLRNLHDDPRFQALLTRMKLTDQENTTWRPSDAPEKVPSKNQRTRI